MLYMSIATLRARQNPDGGWPYVRGGSWTEPTVYAVMAMSEAGETAAARHGLRWIRATRRDDGGWPPRPGIDQSTWVTALVALLPPEQLGAEAHAGAISRLLGLRGEESTPLYRLRQWLLGIETPREQEFPGWPWVPGTASWVGPTSLAILALEKDYNRRPRPHVIERIEQGRSFLERRMCSGGGWNYGAPRALGYDALPYPETTGMALAALRGWKAPEIRQGLDQARRFLEQCRSADALNWLRLGLHAHGQMPPGYCRPQDVAYRTIPEASLDILVSGADAGHSIFWC